MHEYGRLSPSSVATLEPGADTPVPPWHLPNVTIQQATFEVDWNSALESMPEMMSRPVPPYARLWIVDYPETPIGPYREALLLVSARYFMVPRHYIVAAVVTSEEARDANARHWRYASELGDVQLERSGDGFVGTVAVDGGPSVRVDSSAAQQTGTAIIRYDQLVTVASEDGEPAVLNVAPTLGDVHDAWLARGTQLSYDGGDRGSPWLRLRSRNFITCTIGLQDLERGEARKVERPQMGGGGGLP